MCEVEAPERSTSNIRWPPHEPPRSGRHPACRRGRASCRPDLRPSIPACGLFRRLLRRAGSPGSTAGRMPSATVQGPQQLETRKQGANYRERRKLCELLRIGMSARRQACPVTYSAVQSRHELTPTIVARLTAWICFRRAGGLPALPRRSALCGHFAHRISGARERHVHRALGGQGG